MHTSYAYAGNTCEEYLEWCAQNPEDQNMEEYSPEFNGDQEDATCAGVGNTWASGFQYGILDGGATSSVGSYEPIQLIADAWEPL